ncbi:MAG: hypothetical protein QOH79_2782 [Acidimicrobiaceae bacterium]
MTQTISSEEIEAIKQRQQATWASGDYAVIGSTLQIVGESLCEAVDVAAGARVLDVAAGNGNASLAAARRGGEVTATDYVEALLDRARVRADAEGLPLVTRVADAEALPFDDGSFDFVLSTFGVMFTPNPDRSSAELVRVCRPGGRIGLANWTPEGFVGQMFKIVGQHVPPPAGVPSPLAWGTDEPASAALRRRCRGRHRPPSLHLPLPFGGGLLRDVQGVLRPAREGVGRARRRRASLVAAAARGLGRRCEPQDEQRTHDRVGVPRGRDHTKRPRLTP